MDLPILYIKGNGIAEAWENSVVELYNNGLRYNRNGPKDKGGEQIDSTMLIEISHPDKYSFYHKFSNCSWGGLLEYGFEILGAKNFLTVNEFDLKDDNRWPYQYSDRILNYPSNSGSINQMENVINKLSQKPHTRGSSISIWVPNKDITSKDPACLQHIWFGLIPTDKENEYDLNMNYMFRSRNAMIASPINMFGLNIEQNYLRDKLNERCNFKVNNGRIVDYTNSYHISNKDLEKLTNFMNRFTKIKDQGIESRVFSREDTFDMMNECFDDIESKVRNMIISRYEERKGLEQNKDKNKQEVIELSFQKGLRDIKNVSLYLREFIKNVKRD